MIFLAGEVASSAQIDAQEILKAYYQEIGYDNNIKIFDHISLQSDQLRQAVANGGAGDQGIVYGLAVNTCYNYLPMGYYVINRLAQSIDILRTKTDFLLPDGKLFVIVDEESNIIDKLSINIQHRRGVDIREIENVLSPCFAPENTGVAIKDIIINKNSSFLQGGFKNDTGLTGRKIIVDTYGGLAPHGGGAFSGKDPTKIDRTGAYMARYVAKNIVANGLADSCEIAIAYEFGEKYPCCVEVKAQEKGKRYNLLTLIKDKFDLRPQAIIELFDLRNFNYLQTATYGHFTNPQYPWEQIIEL